MSVASHFTASRTSGLRPAPARKPATTTATTTSTTTATTVTTSTTTTTTTITITITTTAAAAAAATRERSARRAVGEMHVFQKALFSPKPKFHYVNTWSTTCHKDLANYVDLAEQRTLGIEPGTSCIRGPIPTN